MKQRKASIFNQLFIAFIFLFFSHIPLSLAEDNGTGFQTSDRSLLNIAIVGSIASFSFACYQGKAPCTLEPGIDIDKINFSLDYGTDNTVKQTRIALGADWIDDLYNGESLKIDGRMEVATFFWNSTLDNPQNRSGYIIGVTPVFNFSPQKMLPNAYLEFGSGPHFLSSTRLENKNKSTHFQMGSIFGFGYGGKIFDIGYRYLHLSNVNIKFPNPGTDFQSIHLTYKF